MQDGQAIALTASDGYSVPLEYFRGREPRAQLLILPALDIQARLYRKFGTGLAGSGIAAVAMEQRGHGRSALRPSRRCDFGFREWLEIDIPAALQWMRNRQPDAPIYLAGHSLGGHLSLMVRADGCPVLSIHCDRDELAPLKAIEGVTGRLLNHAVDWYGITSAELGMKADHVSWAKRPALAARAICTWIDANPHNQYAGRRRGTSESAGDVAGIE